MVLFVLRQCLPSAVCWQSISHCLNNKPFCNLVSRSMSINQKIAVNGANLYHERVGTGSHVVLLIPGAAGSTKTDFAKQLQNMRQDKFTIIGYDPRGYGQSRPPNKKFTTNFLREDADDAAELMKVLGFSCYSILGWSDGANIAAMMAAKYAGQVKKIVVWGGNCFVTPEELELYKKVRDISAWSVAMRQPMIDVYGEATFEKIWHDWVDIFFEMPKQPDGTIDLYKKDLEKINCETLIIHGDKDALVPKLHPEHLHKNIKDSKLVCWEDGKHNLHIKYADRFNKLVEDFLLTAEASP